MREMGALGVCVEDMLLSLLAYVAQTERDGHPHDRGREAFGIMGWWTDYKESHRYKQSPYPCRHVSGLGLKERRRTRIRMLEDCFAFKARGLRLEVPKSEICRVAIETEEELGIDVPGYSGFWGLLGVSAFGPLGLVFGMPTRPPREHTITKKFLIFEKVDLEIFVFFCD